MANIAVFCSGNGSNFEAIVRAERAKKLGAKVTLMVCDRPEAYAIARANKLHIPYVLIPPKLFSSKEEYERALVKVLRNQNISLIALAGFMRILTPYLIHEFKGRILNVHPSLLPAFKGAHAIRDAFEAGVKETGVTVHQVTEELDSGPILAQEKVLVAAEDTLESLEEKVHALEHQLYPATIRRYVSLSVAGRKKDS